MRVDRPADGRRVGPGRFDDFGVCTDGSPLQFDESRAATGFLDNGHLGVWNTALSGMSILPVGVSAGAEAVSTIVRRNLTVAEWEFHLAGRTDESTCPQRPPGG